MPPRPRLFILTLLLLAGLAVAACAHGSPGWVARGTHASADRIYGVGVARGIANPTLAREAAETRARVEVSALLRRDDTKSLVAGTDAGVRIVDHWLAEDGRVYALAVRAR